jgi:ABC-2 type transport system permease protein
MALGIDWQKQRALLGLRGRLTLRQYSKEPGRIVSALLAALFILPMVLGITFGTGWAYVVLPEPWPGQILAIVLVVLWGLWVSLPVFSFNTNEGLDPTRLIVYPLSRRDFVVTLFAGTLFDYPTYFMLPVFIAALLGLGWRFPLALPVLLMALILAYMMMILTSQLVVNIIGGLLQSRRFRDVMIIVFSLLGSSCWFISQACNRLTERLTETVSTDQAAQMEQFLVNFRPLDVLQWLPPGAAARAVEQASVGAWGWSLVWLGYAAAWVAVLAWVWWRVLQRIVTGEGFLVNLSRPSAQVEKTSAVRQDTTWFDWLPADVWQVALKELKTIWRTPQRRVGLIQGFVLPIFLFAFFGLRGGGETASPDIARFSGAFLPIYALFNFWANGQNMLGMETVGLSAIFLTSVPRQHILLGKSLGLAVVSGVPLLVLGLVLSIVQGNALNLLLAPASVCLGLVVLGVMSLASVYLAVPAQFERKTGQNSFSGGGGCLVGLATLFVVPSVIGMAVLPAAAPIAIGIVTNQTWLIILGVVICVLYGPFMLWLGTYLGGRILVSREPELLEATRPRGAVS